MAIPMARWEPQVCPVALPNSFWAEVTQALANAAHSPPLYSNWSGQAT
jgi:hypothetical protein